MRGRVAQSVEQRIENPRVDGSIPPPTTTDSKSRRSKDLRFFSFIRQKIRSITRCSFLFIRLFQVSAKATARHAVIASQVLQCLRVRESRLSEHFPAGLTLIKTVLHHEAAARSEMRRGASAISLRSSIP